MRSGHCSKDQVGFVGTEGGFVLNVAASLVGFGRLS